MPRRLLSLFLMFVALQFGASGAFADEPKEEGSAKPAASEEAKKPEGDEKKDEKKDDDKKADEGPKDDGHGPKKIKVSVWIENIGKLDLATGSFSAEVYVAMSCGAGATGDCTTGIDFGNGKVNGKEEVVEKGPNPKIVKIKADLTADIDLQEYPFDTQILPIEIQSDEGDVDQVVFEYATEGSGIDEKAKLPGWNLGHPEGKVAVETVGGSEKISVVTIEVPITRPPATPLKGLLPVVFMVLVGFSALFIPVKNVANRLAMSTASLLGAVTFHISSTSSLPQVGYLTRTDKFMIATYSICLANIITAVLMFHYDEAKAEKTVGKVHKISKFAVPLYAVVVWALILVVKL